MQFRLPSQVRNAMLAGLIGSVVHSTLMTVRDFAGVIPKFQPYDDMQRILHTVVGGAFSGVTWIIPFITGALFVGFLFGRIYRYLPGNEYIGKGIFFGILVWLIMGLVFFPLVGHGIFAVGLGLGIKPAMLMFGMLLTYSLTMSVVYDRLNALK